MNGSIDPNCRIVLCFVIGITNNHNNKVVDVAVAEGVVDTEVRYV